MEDQHGFFINIKSAQLAKKAELQYVCDEEGRLLRDNKVYPREMGANLPLAAEGEIRHARYPHPKETSAATHRKCPRDQAHGGGSCHNDGGNDKIESSGARRPSRGTAEIPTSTGPDYPTGASPTFHPHLARGKTPQ